VWWDCWHWRPHTVPVRVAVVVLDVVNDPIVLLLWIPLGDDLHDVPLVPLLVSGPEDFYSGAAGKRPGRNSFFHKGRFPFLSRSLPPIVTRRGGVARRHWQ
jgi:hypothetical protein